MPGPPTLLGLPYDAASSFLRGPAEAPPRIREALASSHSNWWTEGGRDLSAPGVLDDAGDVTLAPDAVPADAHAAITAAVARLVAAECRPILLGGDHSVSYPALRAVRAAHPRLTVLHLDAHPDLYASFDGDPLSHASPFARIMEHGLADRLVQVGIRTMNGHQREQAARYGVEVIDMPAWAAGAHPMVTGAVYVSLDLDALDPAFAPGVSHPEPGGLTVREVLTILQALPGPLVGADVVEYNPRRDAAGLTAVVAAKLVKEIAGRMLDTADAPPS